jgi:hypothetical protein
MGLERPTGCGRFFSRFEVLRFWQTRIAEKYVAEIYRSITHYASNRMVHLRCIRFNFACPKAEDFRAASDRFYAHSFHDEWAGAYGVCIHRDICLLRPTVAAGIVLHEVGHIMAQDRSAEGAEPTADQWVRDRLGIEILYSPETLEYLSRGDMRKLGLAACKKLGWKAIPAVVHTNAWGPAGAGAGDGRAATPDKR